MSGSLLFVARPGQPQRRRLIVGAAVAVLALVASLLVGSGASAEVRTWVSDAESLLLDLVNEERAAVGDPDVGPVELTGDLIVEARAWSEQMADDGKVGQNPDAGLDICCWMTLAQSVITADGVATPAEFEPTIRALFSQLMTSGNRANILRQHVDHLGAGVLHESPDGALWVTLYFREWDGSELPPIEPEEETETPTDEPTDEVTDPATDEPTDPVTEESTDEPTEGSTGDGAENATDEPTEPSSDSDAKAEPAAQSDTTTSSQPADDGNDTAVAGDSTESDDIDQPHVWGPVARLAGSDRRGTAAEIASFAFRSADTVVIARSEDFADALTGAPLAITRGAPLLLNPRDVGVAGDGYGLDPVVAAQLERLQPSTVILLGGTMALSEDVEYEVIRRVGADVMRLAGQVRAATAARIARMMLSAEHARHVYVVEGTSGWADAVSVAAVAGWRSSPILLTGRDVAPDVTMDLIREWGIASATLVGGDAAISERVEAQLRRAGLAVARIGGADRYETTTLVADHAVAHGMSTERVWLATGRNFPDALAAGAGAGATGSTVLLVDGQSASRGWRAMDWLRSHRDRIEQLVISGGKAVVVEDVVQAAAHAARVGQ